MTHFALNYTFWRNLVFGALAVVPFVIDARRPMEPHPMHHDHDAHNGAHA